MFCDLNICLVLKINCLIMCFLYDCICWPFRCCSCFNGKKNTKRSSRRRVIPSVEAGYKSSEISTKDWETKEEVSVPQQIKDENLTKEYKVPNDYPTVEECLKDQSLKQGQCIGVGGFAKVYKMLDTKEGTVLAAKRIQTGEFFRSPRIFESLKSELFVMIRAKKHENIVQVVKHFIITDFSLQKEFCYIIMEFANGGTILNKMIVIDSNQPNVKTAQRLTENIAKDYLCQTAKGLAFLHSLKIAHKDLKLNNLLRIIRTDGKEVIKITDFGLSRIRYDSIKNVVLKEYVGSGTVQFMSPQILRLHIYDQFETKLDKLHTYDPFRADCWALGICLYVMITAEFPFAFGKLTEEELINSYKLMKQRKYELSLNTSSAYSESCLDLLSDLLDPNPNTRLTAKLTLRHKWIKDN